jgi:hypothetical protein
LDHTWSTIDHRGIDAKGKRAKLLERSRMSAVADKSPFSKKEKKVQEAANVSFREMRKFTELIK